ncbi:TPA: hypothetical protein L5966_01505 [Pseudomonas aeruginosa]|nr:hypothetical protein [Pseudomonas aeruginosa]
MANELFYAKVIKSVSINYEGKLKSALRLDRDLCTGDFPIAKLARRELLLQAAERGCTYIIEVDVHDEVVYCEGREKTVYWATGRV